MKQNSQNLTYSQNTATTILFSFLLSDEITFQHQSALSKIHHLNILKKKFQLILNSYNHLTKDQRCKILNKTTAQMKN